MAMKFFNAASKQPDESVAEHTMVLIKFAKNRSIWLSDSGTLKVFEMKTYCIPSERFVQFYSFEVLANKNKTNFVYGFFATNDKRKAAPQFG